ncbi:MAG: PAS domain S-box protein [Cyanobacteria bacterium J06634_6]
MKNISAEGKLGVLVRSHPWETTPLGAMTSWPESLKTAVNICLDSYFPMAIWWGRDFRMIYNDAFVPVMGDRHPQAIGQTAQAIFPESWHIIGPQLNSIFETKSADRQENLLIPALRVGYIEESYYTYSYSPLLLANGEVGGVFTTLNETTKQILSERRLETTTALAAKPCEGKTAEEVYQSIISTLADNPADLPFAAIYRLNLAKTQAVLCERTPADIGDIWLPAMMDWRQQDPWKIESVLYYKQAMLVEDVPELFGTVPEGVFSLPVRSAKVMPLFTSTQGSDLTIVKRSVTGLLILGVNPARQLDREYETFYELVTVHVAGLISCISNQDTAQALRLSEDRLSSFVESNVMGILFADTNGNIDNANDEFLRIVGYSREDLATGNLRWSEMTPPEYFSADAQGIAEAQETGSCKPYEKEYIRKDGSRVPVIVGYTLLGEGRTGSVAFILDVSDRKQIEEALEERETELQIVTDTVPVMISFVDAQERYRFNNREYERAFGQTASEIYGKSVRELVGESAYKKVAPYIQQVLTGKQTAYEGWLTLPGQQAPRCYSVTYIPRFNKARSVDGFVTMISDVSDRKRIEAEREELLSREHAAREAAERASRIKDDFLAVVSHELRTPMNSILGWSQILGRGTLAPQKTTRALQAIERNAQSQMRLIDDLLDISRILRGKMSLDRKTVDPQDVIVAALETVELAAEAKNITIETTLAECCVNGDAGRLQQIIWNLLSNAIKFTPEGGSIQVRLRKQGAQAEVVVSDTGKGIPADFLPYVFEHFRQEDYSVTRRFGGLGLGLAITRQLVELHGGSIHVDSEGEGKGTTFTVEVPLASTFTHEVATEPPATGLADLRGVNVLLVDDNPDSLAIAAFSLEAAGATVTTATSGAEALLAIRQQVPQVMVSDIGMPEMDGYQLIAQVRSLPPESGGDVAAIALTAYAGELDFKRALAAGFQRHLTKPISPKALVESILQLL